MRGPSSRTRLAASVIAGVLFAAASVSASIAGGRAAGADGRIAFGQFESHGSTLRVVAADEDGGDRKPLTGPLGSTLHRIDAFSIAVSHDGRRIAFAIGGSRHTSAFYVMNADGTLLRPLAVAGRAPAWSPDGRKIAYEGNRGGIYAMNADGSGTRLLARGSANRSPAWSPDGRRIAFQGTHGIYVMNADGSGRRRLTHVAGDSGPAWAPDGSKIAFTSEVRRSDTIYVMNADGAARRRLTQGPRDTGPVWSPDGRSIAFTHSQTRFSPSGHFDVYVMNADGSGRRKLAANALAPAWYPASTSGGSGGSGLAAGLSDTATITSGGATRYFKTYKPPTLNDASDTSGVPLVVWLSGSPGSNCLRSASLQATINCDLGTSATGGGGEIFQSNWPAKADAAGFILVFPVGEPSTCFGGAFCPTWGSTDSSDPRFLADLLGQIEREANIDTHRIYLAGFSAGASATFGAACQENGRAGARYVLTTDWTGAADQFAGFGIEAGSLGGTAPAESPVNPCAYTPDAKPTIQVTSRADSLSPADPAQPRSCANTTAGTPCQIKASTVAGLYATHWGCTATARRTLPAGGSYGSNVVTDYGGCARGGAYEWVSLGTGTSSAQGPTHSLTGYNRAADVPTLMWNFWSSH